MRCENLFTCFLVICISSSVRCRCRSLAHYVIGFCSSSQLSFQSSLDVWGNSPLSDVSFASTFFWSVVCLLTAFGWSQPSVELDVVQGLAIFHPIQNSSNGQSAPSTPVVVRDLIRPALGSDSPTLPRPVCSLPISSQGPPPTNLSTHLTLSQHLLLSQLTWHRGVRVMGQRRGMPV